MTHFIHNFGLLLLRAGFASALIYGHGSSKLMQLLSGKAISFADPIGIGQALSFYLVTFAETFCALLVLLGFYTRFFSIPLVFSFSVAVFAFHAHDTFSHKEPALLFLFAFSSVFLLGSGKYSVQTIYNKKRPPLSRFSKFLTE